MILISCTPFPGVIMHKVKFRAITLGVKEGAGLKIEN
jgi:hypothetical protein